MEHKPDLFKNVKPTVNITPLIDVLLVLLIIFMVISPTKPHKLDTKVPDKPENVPNEIQLFTPLVVSIGIDQKLSFNSHPVTQEELAGQLSEFLKQRPTNLRTLFIKAPRELRYSAVTKVVDLAKAAGAAPIGLQIDFLE